MTAVEWLTSVLGVLGFIISLTHVIWTIRHHQPMLLVFPSAGHLFEATVHRDDAWLHGEPRTAQFVDILVEVSNRSIRDNSVTSIAWHGPEICPLDTRERYVVGTKPVPEILREMYALRNEGRETTDLYWTPGEQWADLPPVTMPHGGHVQARCSGEVKDLAALGDPPRITVTVTDAHGKAYSAAVTLSHDKPTSADEWLQGGPALASGGACSRKRASA